MGPIGNESTVSARGNLPRRSVSLVERLAALIGSVKTRADTCILLELQLHMDM